MDHSGLANTVYTLQAENELRFEVNLNGEAAFVELQKGSAEMGGSPLANFKVYTIAPNTKAAVFTWYGCTIKIYGEVRILKITRDTPMVSYMNLNGGLDDLREEAKVGQSKGPRVMLLGPPESGKNSAFRILANYAVRSGWCPMLADLDVEQNSISITGTMSVLPLCQLISIEDDFTFETPMIFHYGHYSPKYNVDLYDSLVKKVTESVNAIGRASDVCYQSGVIVNATNWSVWHGYQSLIRAVRAFSIDLILVLDDQHLSQKLTKDISKVVKVLSFPKHEGVFERPKKSCEQKCAMINDYFYGFSKNIYPHLIQIDSSNIEVYRVAQDDGYPQQQQEEEKQRALIPVPISESLIRRVCSTSHADDRSAVSMTTVSGYVAIKKVDTEKKTLTLVSSKPNPFQAKFLLLHEGFVYDNL